MYLIEIYFVAGEGFEPTTFRVMGIYVVWRNILFFLNSFKILDYKMTTIPRARVPTAKKRSTPAGIQLPTPEAA